MRIILINLCALMFCLMGVESIRFNYNYNAEAELWLKLHSTPANWTDARLTCYREGAILASPENETLWSAMQAELAKAMIKSGIFTGINSRYSASKGDYHSIKGTSLCRMPADWYPSKPRHVDNSEDCLIMLPNGSLADVNCSDLYPYVCYAEKYPKDCETVDTGYALDNRTGKYYKFHAEPKNWTNAFAACSGEDAHLAIINSATEAKVLKELCDTNNNMTDILVVHIGHTEWEEHGLWMTIHGDTLKEAGYDTWHAGEPNHRKGSQCQEQRCGAMYIQDGQLDDVHCYEELPFICEKEPGFQYSGDVF